MRTELRRALCSALLLSAGGACMEKELIPPRANALIVHSVLDMDARDQFVAVELTTGALTNQHAVTGATVTITTPDGRELVADEIRDTTTAPVPSYAPTISPVYRVSLDKYGVTLVPGGTYRLHVVLPDGMHEAVGTTTLPGYPGMQTTQPARRTFDRARDTLTLVWPRIVSARGHEVSIVAPFGMTYAVFADTSVMLTGDLRNGVGSNAFRSVQSYQVIVNAVDANYYDYYRGSSDPFTGSSVVNHLIGATGVFGSLVRVKTQVLDVR